MAILKTLLFVHCIAEECKLLFDKITEEKPKPPPVIPKVTPPPISHRERRSVKSVKSKEEPVKPQIEEKTLPPKVDNYKNYNYDYTTPSPAINDLPSEQNCSGYNSINVTPGYNGTYPYPYNRYKLFSIILIKLLKLMSILIVIILYFKISSTSSSNTK